MSNDALKKQEELRQRLKGAGGGTRHSEVVDQPPAGGFAAKLKTALGVAQPDNDATREVQRINDNLVVLKAMCAARGRPVQEHPYYQKNVRTIEKALDSGTAAAGGNWVPTGFSEGLIESVYAASEIAQAFPQVDMPNNPHRLFLANSRTHAKLATESTSDDVYASAQLLPATTPSTGKVDLDAVKLSHRIAVSSEYMEDSAVDLDSLTREIIEGQGYAVDDAIINGDTTASHMDTDISSSDDRRKAWDGLRDTCLNTTSNTVGNNANPLTLASIRALRKALDPDYAARSNDLLLIFGNAGMNDLMGDANIATLYAFGENAAVRTGGVGPIFDFGGVFNAAQMREVLDSAGVYNASGTLTSTILVNKKAWVIGRMRNLMVEFEKAPGTDRYILSATQRLIFKKVRASTDKSEALLINQST